MVFPAERTAFATEFIADALVANNPRSLPSACGPFDGTPLAEWIMSYRAVEDLDVDSLSMVEVVVAAEEKFGVSIPDDEVKNLKTVGDAVSFIERASANA